MDKSFFWTVFKADLLFTLCSVTFTVLLTVGLAVWRKRRLKKASANIETLKGPRAFIVGGKDPNPGHCPLCGQTWPLAGPVVPEKKPEEPKAAE